MKNLNIKINKELHTTTADLIASVVEETNAPSEQVTLFLDSVSKVINDTIKAGGRVELRNFAVFEGREFEAFDRPLRKVRFSSAFQSELTQIFDHVHQSDPFYLSV